MVVGAFYEAPVCSRFVACTSFMLRAGLDLDGFAG